MGAEIERVEGTYICTYVHLIIGNHTLIPTHSV